VAGIPVFVNSRDRLTPLAELVAWLERAGVAEIYIIDNDSAYRPLLAYYEESPHTIIRLGRNVGKNALWDADGLFDLTRGRPFAYSDSDIVPDPACPLDAIDVFLELLSRYRDGNPGVHKAGFGIRYDDIPDHYSHKAQAIACERAAYSWPLGEGAYYTTIDTQFAVYRPNSHVRPHCAARTAWPYVARHHSYYLALDDLNDEDAFYAKRSKDETAPTVFTHWATPKLTGPQAAPPPPLPGIVARARWRLRGSRRLRA
jgi:hypothetical protein